jgi:hypothetical protein
MKKKKKIKKWDLHSKFGLGHGLRPLGISLACCLLLPYITLKAPRKRSKMSPSTVHLLVHLPYLSHTRQHKAFRLLNWGVFCIYDLLFHKVINIFFFLIIPPPPPPLSIYIQEIYISLIKDQSFSQQFHPRTFHDALISAQIWFVCVCVCVCVWCVYIYIYIGHWSIIYDWIKDGFKHIFFSFYILKKIFDEVILLLMCCEFVIIMFL